LDWAIAASMRRIIYVWSTSESLNHFKNVLQPCIKYFTLQGRKESEKVWQFAKGRSLKITRDVAHIILVFYYAYKI